MNKSVWSNRKRRAGWAAGWVLLLMMAAVWGVVGQVSAQSEPPTDDEVNAVAKELYCPVCENIPLDVCGTQACAQWRELIREKLAEGWTREQIQDYFALHYGDRVLAEPPRRGLNWLVYALPLATLLVGGVIVAQTLRRTRRKPAANAAPAADVNPAADPYLAEIEKELRQRPE